MIDAYIAHFDTKYLYNFWRPVTAIRAGDTDAERRHRGRSGLDAVSGDAEHPGLPLGTQHGGRGGGSGADAFLQARRAPIHRHERRTVSRHRRERSRPSGMPRWKTPSPASYAGIHFRTPITDGLRLGERVGRFVFTHALKPGK